MGRSADACPSGAILAPMPPSVPPASPGWKVHRTWGAPTWHQNSWGNPARGTSHTSCESQIKLTLMRL